MFDFILNLILKSILIALGNQSLFKGTNLY